MTNDPLRTNDAYGLNTHGMAWLSDRAKALTGSKQSTSASATSAIVTASCAVAVSRPVDSTLSACHSPHAISANASRRIAAIQTSAWRLVDAPQDPHLDR